ncbi:MAG: hypothetical protein ABI728_11170 [Betaproteobacteria bacterium]
MTGIGALLGILRRGGAVLALFFGLFGSLFIKLDCEPAPLRPGFVLGPMMEHSLPRAILLARVNPAVFVTRPLSLALLLIALALLVAVVLPTLRKNANNLFWSNDD